MSTPPRLKRSSGSGAVAPGAPAEGAPAEGAPAEGAGGGAEEAADAGPDLARLSTTSFLVLGLLAAHGPMTPYELKARVSGSVGYFWSFPHSQLYGEPARLVGLGLATEEREESGRRRRRYAVTGTGRRAVADWLADPVEGHPQIRDLALLKLFLGSLVPPERIAELARAQERAHRERVAVYDSIDAALRRGGRPVRHEHATVRLGLAYERAATAFWAEIAQEWHGDGRNQSRESRPSEP